MGSRASEEEMGIGRLRQAAAAAPRMHGDLLSPTRAIHITAAVASHPSARGGEHGRPGGPAGPPVSRPGHRRTFRVACKRVSRCSKASGSQQRGGTSGSWGGWLT